MGVSQSLDLNANEVIERTALTDASLKILELEARNRQLIKENIRLAEEREAAVSKSLEFIGIVTHDLRSSTLSVDGFCAVLQSILGGVSSQNCEEIQSLLADIRRLSKDSVDLIHTYSKFFQGLATSKVVFGKTPIILFLRGMFEKMPYVNIINLSGIDNSNVITSVEMTPIQIVFANLLANSIKFAKPGVDLKINITVNENDDYIEVHFQDNGRGANSQAINMIFDMFFKDKSKKSGMGLGLAVCKHLIELYGGTIRAESEEGNGMETIFTIPKYKENKQDS